MKKIISFVPLVVLTLLFMVSCSKENDLNYSVKEVNGVKTFKNSSTPSNPDFNYNFKEVLTIVGEDKKESEKSGEERIFTKSSFISIDDQSNIFIADLGSNQIKKFDMEGNFITSFGGLGTGPGEYSSINYLLVHNDTVYVSDSQSSRLVKFNLDGKYFSTKKFKTRIPEFFTSAGRNNLVAGLNIETEMNKSEVFIITSVGIFNSKFELGTSFKSNKVGFDPAKPNINPMDLVTPFAIKNNNLFLAEISEDTYKVKVFDVNNSKNIYNIQKSYRKVKMDKAKQEKMSKSVNVSNDETGDTENKMKEMYNKAIQSVWIDKYDRVWVLNSRKKSESDKQLHFDIFEKGIYLNTIKIDFYDGDTDFEVGYMLKLLNDKVYLIDDRDDSSIKVRVFDY